MTPRCFNYSLGFASAISLIIMIVGGSILPQQADTRGYSSTSQEDATKLSAEAYSAKITHSTGFAMVIAGAGVILICFGAFIYARHKREMASLVVHTIPQASPRPVPLEETGPPPNIIIRPQTAILIKEKTRRNLIQII
jgi:hypothetical protein